MKWNYKKPKKKLCLQGNYGVNLYLCISGFLLLLTTLCILTGMTGLERIISTTDGFVDHFMHIAFASDPNRIYTFSRDACFPPLAYCFYYFLWKLNPVKVDDKLDWEAFKYAEHNLVILCMFYIMISMLLLYLVSRYLDFISLEKQILVTVLILFSWPVFGISFQDGNIVILISIILGLAFYFKDSKSKLGREMALILIAIAAGFKIYPAFAGIVYIKEKRWSETARLVIYGVLFFFLPFLFFGGIAGLKNFMGILLTHESNIVYRYNTVRGALNSLFGAIGFDAGFGNMIAIISEQLFLLISTIMILLSKKEWKTFTYIGAVLAFYIPINYAYTAVYFLPGFLCLLRKLSTKERMGWENLFYIVCFSNIFTLPCYFKVINRPVGYGIFMIAFLMMGVILISDLVHIRICKKNR